MTHDELLERLNELKYDVGDSGMNEESKAIYALRAVVELHTNTEDGYCAWCYLCNYDRTGLSMDSAMYAYPCPTIQAIEGQLK